MKLTKLLFPEIVKGSRGTGNPMMDKFFKNRLDSVSFIDEGVAIQTNDDFVFAEMNNPDFASFYGQAKRANLEKWPVFHLCRDFGEALITLKDREIIESHLPDFSGYISLPSGLINDIEGVYIRVGTIDPKTGLHPSIWDERGVLISYHSEISENGGFAVGRFNFKLRDRKSVSEISKFFGDDEDNPDAQERIQIARLMLNVIVYLHSEDPEILSLVPSHGRSVREQGARSVAGHVNLCTIPVKAINWDYQRVVKYEDAETFVDTFPRWQPCGPKLSKVKLIFVKEHTRSYKKRMEES